MTTPANQSQVLQTYTLLQIAAEALFGLKPNASAASPGVTPAVDFGPGGALLVEGNLHSSRFTPEQAKQFAAEWRVISHQPNTATGFSGTLFQYIGAPDAARGLTTNQLVVSLRSTEFIEDFARDNQATNTLELKAGGWAFGQVADMDTWFSRAKADNPSAFAAAPGGKVDVTGYSLGGALAASFYELYSAQVNQVYTFNGAGVGSLKSGATLRGVIDQFKITRERDNSSLFTDPVARAEYLRLRDLYRVGNDFTDSTVLANVVALDTLILASKDSTQLAQLFMLKDALSNIRSIAAVAVSVPKLTGGDGVAPPRPANILPGDIAGLGLDYQIAVHQAMKSTTSRATSGGIVSAVDWVLQANFRMVDGGARPGVHDVYGDTVPSFVANSQLHYGKPIPVFIEEQPRTRGTVIGDAASLSWADKEVRLLVDRYDRNDFGDTHSIVLLEDSLRLQAALTVLAPGTLQKTLNALLAAASNGKRETISGDPGKADGHTLESLLDMARRVLLGPTVSQLTEIEVKDNTGKTVNPLEGGTWAVPQLRNEYEKGILDLQSTDVLKLKDLLTLQLGMEGKNSRVDFSAFVSLQTLSVLTFGAVAGSESKLETHLKEHGWGSLHAQWKDDKDLAPAERGVGKETFSDTWITRRTELLNGLVARNTWNYDTRVLPMRTPLGAARYQDLQSGTDFTVSNSPIDQTTELAQVVFGKVGADSRSGGRLADFLFGGAGNDLLSGQAGADHLEGNADNDTLIGGAGSDTLFGGAGDDRYVFLRSELTRSETDVIGDADGQGRLLLATGLDANTQAPLNPAELVLSGWTPIPRQPGDSPLAAPRYRSGVYELSATGPGLWTLSARDGSLPGEVTLRHDSSAKTLTLDFGRDRAGIQIKDWDNGELGIQLPGYQPPAAPGATQGLAATRDLALLQIAAGVDLYAALGDPAGLKSRLTGAVGGSGTADRLTPAQADYLLANYELLHQYGNDGSGFSATVFRRRPTLDAQGKPLPQDGSDPYVIAFRGNDLEPGRVGGLAKDGGLGAMREINRTGFAWGQLDAMERWWAGLGQGEILNRAGQRVSAGAAKEAFGASNNLVIGTGVGAHLAAAFTLLHPEKVGQALGFDGPGLGRMSDGSPITAAQLRGKLDQFLLLMANRASGYFTGFTDQIRAAGGPWLQNYALALEADRPSEVQFSGYYDVLTNAPGLGGGVMGGGWDSYQVSRGWENYWDGANIYHSQLYQFAVDWFGRDTLGAGQGVAGSSGDVRGVGSSQLASAWAAYQAQANQDPWGGPSDIDAFALPGLSLGGAAASTNGKYTHWSLQPDRLDPSTLLGGQGLGGTQQRLWVEDSLGAATPASLAELERQAYEHGWGNNTALRQPARLNDGTETGLMAPRRRNFLFTAPRKNILAANFSFA